MRGSAAFRTGVAPGGALAPGWVKNELWRRARAVPSLDLRFAENKSLVDATTGASLVTFTRASSGTFVGSDGVLRTAVTNLLLRSEEFDNASWTKVGVTVTANSIASPTGALTADKLVESSINENHRLEQPIAFVASSSYSTSFYAKAAERNIVFTRNFFPGQGSYNCAFDLSNGTVQFNGLGQTGAITDVGNGWYRCSVTASTTSAGAGGIRIGVAATAITSDANPTYLGDGTSGIYLWGAQLEQSTTVGEYIPTTSTINSAPRFDHNPTTGESLGLLVEEARTNLCLRSEEFNNVAWTLFGTASRTANTTVAPNGTTTADSVTLPVSSGIFQLVSGSANTAYTFSIWIRCDTTQSVRLVINTNLSDPTTLTVTATSSWQRFSITKTTSVGTLTVGGQIDTGGGNTFFLWGAQLEAGAFATSYIPTTTAAATRSADVASITGSNFSSWYNQTEGTVFADVTLTRPPSTIGVNILGIGDGTNSNRVQLNSGSSSAGNINGVVTTGGVAQAQPLVGSISSVGPHKIGFGYATNNVQIGVNGSLGTEDTSATMPSTITAAYLANGANPIAPASMTFARLTFWPTRLASNILQSITQ